MLLVFMLTLYQLFFEATILYRISDWPWICRKFSRQRRLYNLLLLYGAFMKIKKYISIFLRIEIYFLIFFTLHSCRYKDRCALHEIKSEQSERVDHCRRRYLASSFSSVAQNSGIAVKKPSRFPCQYSPSRSRSQVPASLEHIPYRLFAPGYSLSSLRRTRPPEPATRRNRSCGWPA